MKPQPNQEQLILSVLPRTVDQAMTVMGLFEALEPCDQGRFGSPSNLSKAIDQLRRRAKLPGIVNGLSEIINGRTRLTWYWNEHEKQFLQPLALDMADTSEPDTENGIQALAETAHQQPGDNPVETPQDETQPVEHEESADALEIQSDEMASDLMDMHAMHNPVPAIDAALESLARDGYMILDPLSEADAFICNVVNRLKWAEQAPPKPATIGDKGLKIDTLRNLAPLMSTDISDVLMNIADDLDALEAA